MLTRKEKENLFGGGALMQKLRENVFVANNMQQAQNLAEHYGLIIVGEVTDFVPQKEVTLH